MDVLMITCPNTGRAVPPGIETDALSFASLPDVPTQTKCPVCGSVHVYDKRKGPGASQRRDGLMRRSRLGMAIVQTERSLSQDLFLGSGL